MICSIQNPYQVPLPAHVGVSGGRTSGYLAWHVWEATDHSPEVRYIFTNTGYEHPKTIEFIRRMRDDWGLPIVALEYDHPCDGSGPQSGMMVYERQLEDLSVDGTPFRTLMRAVHAYRLSSPDQDCEACEGSGVISGAMFSVQCAICGGSGQRQNFSPLPNAATRLCTSYLKEKTANEWKRVNGISDAIFVPGLRADEPRRVAKARARGDAVPLAVAGVTKPLILEWWQSQHFDLEIPDIRGNCSGCFMKNKGKLLHLAHYYPDDLTPFAAMEADYQDRIDRRYPYSWYLERGGRLTDEAADQLLAPAVQEALFGVEGEEMPCHCTD